MNSLSSTLTIPSRNHLPNQEPVQNGINQNQTQFTSSMYFSLFSLYLLTLLLRKNNSNWKSKCPETSTPQKTRLQIGIHSKSHFFPWTPWLEKREKCPLQTQIHRERSNKQKHHRQHLTSIERNRFGKSNATQAMNPTFQCTNPKKKINFEQNH